MLDRVCLTCMFAAQAYCVFWGLSKWILSCFCRSSTNSGSGGSPARPRPNEEGVVLVTVGKRGGGGGDKWLSPM